MQMPRHHLSLPTILAIGLTTATANAAEKSQYTCRSGDLVRRVVIEVGELNTGLPCEVVYWKDSEAPGVRRVLWNARTDAEFCDAKAAGLVEKLDSSGWQCGDAVTSQPAASVQPQPPAQPSTPVPQPATAASTPDPATAGNDLQPSELGVTNPIPPPSSADTAVTPTTPVLADDPSPQTAALTPAPQPTSQVTEQLQTVIAQNLESLNQSVDGDFQAEVGQFGDLNADGLDDAVVFFNYQSSTADFTQFVAAYLFNGDSYHLAATKPVGGTERAVEKVEIEDIVNGSILLRLQLNDASQTENRSAAMTLKDGQLVEIE
jgi:hypothetical protein